LIDLYLASKSPRRFELLQQLQLHPQVVDADCDESVFLNENPADYVLRVSRDKAQAGWQQVRDFDVIKPVLAADTAVVIDDQILGKPEDFMHAKAMWNRLSGREHRVFSAVVIQLARQIEHAVHESRVRMRHISEAEMRAYWDAGEPQDKAGAYAVQGVAACFIEQISGSYSAIMGLPLYETAQLLNKFNIPVLGRSSLEQDS